MDEYFVTTKVPNILCGDCRSDLNLVSSVFFDALMIVMSLTDSEKRKDSKYDEIVMKSKDAMSKKAVHA